jgi:ABC-type transport system involved in multi-copper enzyme maturation permease subunit
MAEPATLPSRPGVARPRAGFSLVGPLFFYDLVRLARRGRSILLRVTYTLTLLVALFIAYHNHFPSHNLLAAPLAPALTVQPRELSALGESFVFSILVVQSAAVLILTPAYLAGVIAEERERGTLELLLTTQLSDHEIVLGKLVARLTHLAGVLLAGLPLLALTQLWGGVDMRLVLAAFFVTGLNLLSIGAISVFSSVICRSVLAAVITSYALTAAFFLVGMACPLGAVSTPAGMFEALASQPVTPFPVRTITAPSGRSVSEVIWLLGICTVFHGLPVLLFVVSAIGNLRPSPGWRASRALRESPGPLATTTNVVDEWGPFDLSVPPPSARGNLPPIGDWPLLWKETLPAARGETVTRSFERSLKASWPALVMLLGIASVAVYFVRERALQRSEGLQALGTLVRMPVLATTGLWCMALAFRSAAGISRERDQGTLEGLLMLPVSRPALLVAKWAGPILYARGFGYMLLILLFVALLSGLVHPIGIALLTMALAAHVAFLASVGVWLSAASRTTLWARIAMALVLLAFLGLSLRSMLPDVRGGVSLQRSPSVIGPQPWILLPWRSFISEVGVNAPGAWWFLAFPPYQYTAAVNAGDSLFVGRLIAAECGILGYGLVARLLWALACRRLQGEQRR